MCLHCGPVSDCGVVRWMTPVSYTVCKKCNVAVSAAHKLSLYIYRHIHYLLMHLATCIDSQSPLLLHVRSVETDCTWAAVPPVPFSVHGLANALLQGFPSNPHLDTIDLQDLRPALAIQHLHINPGTDGGGRGRARFCGCLRSAHCVATHFFR